jgi:uncharacterized protein YhbP (UPF0306 family)
MDEDVIPMEELKRIIRSILESGFTMSLATIDGNGVWASNLTYVHDADFNLYWLSQTNVRHSEAIIESPDVSATITLSSNPNREVIGLQISGVAEKLKSEIPEITEMRRIKSNDAPPSHQDGSLYPIVAWYRLKPKKIELMHVPLFGFKKKILEL